MHRLVNVSEKNIRAYWLRVTSFLPGATISFDRQNPIAVDSLIGWQVEPGGKTWDSVDLTGTITVEVGDDPREPYPGPPNPPGSSFATGQVNAAIQPAPAVAAYLAAKTSSGNNVGGATVAGAAAVTTGPGTAVINNQPAAATQATATVAAGGAGQRHIARFVTICLEAVAAQADIIFNLRDGASGAGAVLWTIRLALAAGSTYAQTHNLGDVVGSSATAMTIESAAAPAATNFASVSLGYYDAQ